MKKRINIVQSFSTFLSFSASFQKLTCQWVVETKLERNIQKKLQMYPGQAPEFWVRHFLEVIQDLSHNATRDASENKQKLVAQEHLSAYLQEACYWAAYQIHNKFSSINCKYSLEDLFQIGSLFVSVPGKLKNFNVKYQYSLENYAKVAIFRFIKNEIYSQNIESKQEKYSDYGLLKDLSNKELKEALALQGININQFDSYCLAKQCFDIICHPQQRQGNCKLEPPKHSDLIQIVDLYNQRINKLKLLETSVDINKIQKMLSTCILAARHYRTKRVLPLQNNEIFSEGIPTPWNTLIQIEEREQIESIIENIFIDIPDVGQTIFKLWLGLDITQTEITTVLKSNYPELLHQYQVARKLSKYNRDILKSFVQRWNQLNPEILLNEKNIETLHENLNECLQAYCKRLLYVEFQQLNNQEYYKINSTLVLAFQHKLECSLNLNYDSLQSVNTKISSFIDEYLRFADVDKKSSLKLMGSIIYTSR